MADISSITLPDGTSYSIKGQKIPWAIVDSTSTSTAFTATVPGITKLESGVYCILKNNKVTSASGFTLNINGLGAKPVYRVDAASARATTHFAVNVTWMFVYNETRVADGCWDLVYLYNTNSTYAGYSFGFGYGECTTAAETVEKTCTITNYTLHNGGIVSIKFTNDVCAGATLNIRTRGAKPIYYRDAAIAADVIKAGDVATFQYYDGYYYLIAIDRVANYKISLSGTTLVFT